MTIKESQFNGQWAINYIHIIGIPEIVICVKGTNILQFIVFIVAALHRGGPCIDTRPGLQRNHKISDPVNSAPTGCHS